MSDEERTDPRAMEAKAREEDGRDEEDEDASSPFDHPMFLPVLLFALAGWFGFDGWFNESIESVRFNRYGFFFLLGAALYFTASEFTSLRFLLPALFLSYATWLGAFDLLGSDDAWWRNDEWARHFNRYGAIACVVSAAITAVRERMRRGAAGQA